jgi:hypothetical protein
MRAWAAGLVEPHSDAAAETTPPEQVMKLKKKNRKQPRAARAKRRYRRCAPWGALLGKPIERLPRFLIDGLCNGKAEDEQKAVRDGEDRRVQALQLEKMLKLLRHFGIAETAGWRPWYELALKIALVLDDRLKIVDAPPKKRPKTAPPYEGKMLLEAVVAPQAGPDVKVLAVLAELQTKEETWPAGYGARSIDSGPRANGADREG